MYQLKPQKLGAQVIGVNLQDDIPDCVIDEIKCDIIKHKLLLFRDQDVLSEDRQIIVSRWFGEIDVRGYDQHPKSPSPLILRVSNDEVEGFRYIQFNCYDQPLLWAANLLLEAKWPSQKMEFHIQMNLLVL